MKQFYPKKYGMSWNQTSNHLLLLSLMMEVLLIIELQYRTGKGNKISFRETNMVPNCYCF